MKVFIFGAGASKGSFEDVNARESVPLANELFGAAFQSFRLFPGDHYIEIMPEETWNHCAEQVRIHDGSLEKWLTQRWAEIESKRQESTKFAERAFFGSVTFYLWNLLQGVSKRYASGNGYTVLLRRLLSQDEDKAMISFNYDTLLDRAVQNIDRNPLQTMTDYSSARLMKPHGSVNWILPSRMTDRTFPTESQIDSGARLRRATASFYNGAPLRYSDVKVYDPQHGVSVNLKCPIYRRVKCRTYDRRDAPIIVVRDGSKMIV